MYQGSLICVKKCRNFNTNSNNKYKVTIKKKQQQQQQDIGIKIGCESVNELYILYYS